MFRRFVPSLIVVAALSASAAAQAAPVAVSFTGYTTGSVDLSIASPAGSAVRAGEFSGTAGAMSFTSYCIELTQYIAVPGGPYTDYDRRSAQGDGRFSTTQLDRLNRLYTNYLADSRLGAANSAGFQLAIWEITYDGASASLGLAAGNFRLGSGNGSASAVDAIQHATTYLTGLDNKPISNLVFEVLASPTHQDQLVSRVPEPGTLALALTGLVGWAGWRRGRRAA